LQVNVLLFEHEADLLVWYSHTERQWQGCLQSHIFDFAQEANFWCRRRNIGDGEEEATEDTAAAVLCTTRLTRLQWLVTNYCHRRCRLWSHDTKSHNFQYQGNWKHVVQYSFTALALVPFTN